MLHCFKLCILTQSIYFLCPISFGVICRGKFNSNIAQCVKKFSIGSSYAVNILCRLGVHLGWTRAALKAHLICCDPLVVALFNNLKSNEYLFIDTGVMKMKWFLSLTGCHFQPLARNGTECEAKTIELSLPTSGGYQWAFLNFLRLIAVKKPYQIKKSIIS